MASRRKRNKKIAKYRRPIHINIGMVVFGAIFIYLLISIFLYLTSSRINAYEVREGQISKDYSYTGLAIRQEEVFYAEQSGYVNYYALDGEKVGTGGNVYTLDESGQVTKALKSGETAQGELDQDDLKEVQSSILTFIRNFDNAGFEDVYEFKNTLDNKILELIHNNLMEGLDSVTDGTSNFKTYQAEKEGVAVFSVDGLEDITPDDVTTEMIQEAAYHKDSLKSDEIISKGDPAYKLITDESWTIMFELDAETAQEMREYKDSEQSFFNVRFAKDRSLSKVRMDQFEVVEQNGSFFGKIELEDSMVRFAKERFVEIELELENRTGLKVPRSAIVEKEFYLVPEAYIHNSKGTDRILVETSDENGNPQEQFVDVTIYYTRVEDDVTYCYLDPEIVKKGDNLIGEDTNQRFIVGKKDQIQGVYNINKGYAVFRQVEILHGNNDYCIVLGSSDYGLAIYDHIALDGTTVKEDDIVFK